MIKESPESHNPMATERFELEAGDGSGKVNTHNLIP